MVVQNAAIPPTAVIMSMLHELPETSHVPDLCSRSVLSLLGQAALTHCPVDTLLAALIASSAPIFGLQGIEMDQSQYGREAEFIRYGEECVAIARMARTSAQRIMLLHIAETFRCLADSEKEKPVLTLH